MNQSKGGETAGGKGPSVNLVFPEYYGASMRPLGPALLWFGHLYCATGPFVSLRPHEVFMALGMRAHARGLPIARLFNATVQVLQQSTQSAIAATAGMEQLDSRITRLALVAPGGHSDYAGVRSDFSGAIPEALQLLNDPEYVRVACSQFVWRCYEYYLESAEDADAVLDELSREAGTDASAALLGEGLIHHFSSVTDSFSALVVGNQRSLALLARFGEVEMGFANESIVEPVAFERDYLAAAVFETTLAGLCSPLSGDSAEDYRRVLDDEADALAAAKRKCFIAADSLLEKRASPDAVGTLLVQTVADMRAEVEAIARIDSSTWRSYAASLSSDPAIWGSVAGSLGGLTGALPPVAMAAAAVTVLAEAGAKAVAHSSERRRILRKADWRFVYTLRQPS
jgi:hypothetical protein